MNSGTSLNRNSSLRSLPGVDNDAIHDSDSRSDDVTDDCNQNVKVGEEGSEAVDGRLVR